MQLVSKTWWIVGIYQHVAKTGNATRRRLLLECLADIQCQARAKGYHFMVLGDANAAPEGGRWHCPVHSPLWASDALTNQWATDQGLTEAPRPRMIPTWRASLRKCSAVLDRVWFYPAGLGISKVFTKWADEVTSFDHALIFVKLPHSEAGTGFAGACRDGWQESAPPRLLVDMQLLKARRDELCRSLPGWMAGERASPLTSRYATAQSPPRRILDGRWREGAPTSKRRESSRSI